MLRFAPSPIADMHIGDLRVALFNYIVAKQRGEELLVRMEDTDKEHVVEGKDKEILDILGLFGIEYSNVIHQSEQLRYHRMMAIQLLGDKKAFNCFCTPAELALKREIAKKAGKPFHYDDTCTHLLPEQTIDNENPFTIRLRRPEKAIVVDDLIKGKRSFSPDEVDAFVIMTAEKFPTYNFASAVDDMISDVSLVIRDEKYLDETPRQIAVRDALGYEKTMAYAHLPAILDDAGREMSSGDDALTVKWLLEEGFLPSAIINYLIALGNKTPQETFTLEEAVAWFDLKSISDAPAHFDMDALKSLNGQHLRDLDDKELSRYVGFADEAIGKLAKVFLEEARTLKELRPKIEAIFAPKTPPEAFAKQAETLRKVIMSAPHFETFDAFKAHLVKESGLESKELSQTLRHIITGRGDGPEVTDLYVHLKDFLGEIVK